MIVDERTYTIAPGCFERYLERHKALALPLMRRYLGEPLAYYRTRSPDSDQFVHLWQYENLADREARRARMYQDPDWLIYRAETGATGWVLQQETRLLEHLPLQPPVTWQSGATRQP